MLKKINNSVGFTLTETLVAVVILVMISAAALPAALNAYQNAVDAANAQVLLSTTVNALRSELSTAWNVSVDTEDTTKISYQSAATGDTSVISISEDDIIMLQEYSRAENPGWWGEEKPTASPRPIATGAMRRTTRNSEESMTVTYDSATFNGTYITITGLKVKRDETVLAEMPEETGLLIRIMDTESTNGTTGG